MRNERIKARIFGDDVKVCNRIGAGKNAEVVGDMKVQRIRAGRLEHDVITAVTQFLHRDGKLAVDFCVALAQENPNMKLFSLQQRQRLDVHVLVIDQYKMELQAWHLQVIENSILDSKRI